MMPNSQDGRERLARLEAQHENKDREIKLIRETLEGIETEVGRISLRVEKSLSFIGGIAFTFSAMGAAFAVAVTWALSKLGVNI